MDIKVIYEDVDVLVVDEASQMPMPNVFGSMFFLYLIYFPLMVVWGLYNLLSKFRFFNEAEASQAKSILIGLTLSFLFGTSTNLIIPWATKTSATEQYGPLGVIFLVSFVAHAIIKHQLLNVKLIATEIFALAISFTMLINIAFAESPAQLILRAALFITVVLS